MIGNIYMDYDYDLCQFLKRISDSVITCFEQLLRDVLKFIRSVSLRHYIFQ